MLNLYIFFKIFDIFADSGCVESSSRNGCGHFAGYGSGRSSGIRSGLWRISSLGKLQTTPFNTDIHETLFFFRSFPKAIAKIRSQFLRTFLFFFFTSETIFFPFLSLSFQSTARSFVSLYCLSHNSFVLIKQLNLNIAYLVATATSPHRIMGLVSYTHTHAPYSYVSFASFDERLCFPSMEISYICQMTRLHANLQTILKNIYQAKCIPLRVFQHKKKTKY